MSGCLIMHRHGRRYLAPRGTRNDPFEARPSSFLLPSTLYAGPPRDRDPRRGDEDARPGGPGVGDRGAQRGQDPRGHLENDVRRGGFLVRGAPVWWRELPSGDRQGKRVAASATAPDKTMHNEPFEVTESMVFNAIREADSIGRAWRAETPLNHRGIDEASARQSS